MSELNTNCSVHYVGQPLLDGMNDYFFIVHLLAGEPWILASLTSAAVEYTLNQAIKSISIFQYKLDISQVRLQYCWHNVSRNLQQIYKYQFVNSSCFVTKHINMTCFP